MSRPELMLCGDEERASDCALGALILVRGLLEEEEGSTEVKLYILDHQRAIRRSSDSLIVALLRDSQEYARHTSTSRKYGDFARSPKLRCAPWIGRDICPEIGD